MIQPESFGVIVAVAVAVAIDDGTAVAVDAAAILVVAAIAITVKWEDSDWVTSHWVLVLVYLQIVN